jgi:hypothetical protein
MSDTALTVAIARQYLERYVPPNEDFLPMLNQACEILINKGKYKGMVIDCIFDSSTGYITLPYEIQSILAVTVRNVPEVVFGEFQTYITTGPGKLKFDMQNQGILVDWGADVPTTVSPDPQEPATLKLTIAKAADAGKSMRIYGKYRNGDDFVDADGVRGVTITSVFPTVTTTLEAAYITGVELPDGRIDNWYLYGTVDGTDTLLSRYYPFESIPNYKRYITQTIQDSASSNIYPTIGLKCMRRFIPMQAETDFVWPGNISALKWALKALVHEDAGYEEKAAAEWEMAVSRLDEQTRASRGSALMPIPFAPFGPGNRTLINTW